MKTKGGKEIKWRKWINSQIMGKREAGEEKAEEEKEKEDEEKAEEDKEKEKVLAEQREKHKIADKFK